MMSKKLRPIQTHKANKIYEIIRCLSAIVRCVRGEYTFTTRRDFIFPFSSQHTAHPHQSHRHRVVFHLLRDGIMASRCDFPTQKRIRIRTQNSVRI